MNNFSQADEHQHGEKQLPKFDSDTNLSLNTMPTARIAHLERGEKECFGLASATLSDAVGPAARVVDCGQFSGHWLTNALDMLERPKAGVTLATVVDLRLVERLRDHASTAQISHLAHDVTASPWPLETMAVGKTLAIMSGGAFGALGFEEAFSFLESAAHALNEGDFVALTLDTRQDGATLEILYEEFLRPVILHTLGNLPKNDGVSPRVFFDPASNSLKFGAIILIAGTHDVNGVCYQVEKGDWIGLGAIRIFDLDKSVDFHPDFALHARWHSLDQTTALVLLRKL